MPERGDIRTTMGAARRRFRAWRRHRPFWGGLLLILSALWLLLAPAAQQALLPISMLVLAGPTGLAGYFVPLLLVTCGILAWFQPGQRAFLGVTAMLLALGSFLVSNLGGFVVGMLVGIVGAALLLAWSPDPRRPTGRRRRGLIRGAVFWRRDTSSLTPDDGPLAVLALPMALLLVFPSSLLPPRLGDFDLLEFLCPICVDDDEEEDQDRGPSFLGNGDDDDANGDARPPDGVGDTADAEDEDEADEEDDTLQEGDAADCQLLTGEAGQTDDGEEMLAAVEACLAAQEEGTLPEAPATDEGCFTGSTAESGLTADSLFMRGASFDGVVECATADGAQRYLRMSMGTAEYTDAELTFDTVGGAATLDLPEMTMSGGVVLHVTRMHVRILGIPITFTPDFPPPLLLPIMEVTDVDVDDPMASTAAMSIPNLNLRVS